MHGTVLSIVSDMMTKADCRLANDAPAFALCEDLEQLINRQITTSSYPLTSNTAENRSGNDLSNALLLSCLESRP
jgi:hypothetical protein